MNVKFIPVDELRNWWPHIRPGLDKIKTKSPENWIPEDVYTDCFNQKSMLWVTFEESRFSGFFILQPMGHTMHVWCAWSLENRHETLENGLKFIKDIASQGKCKFISFSSHRAGWQKRAKQIGFRPKQWICEV